MLERKKMAIKILKPYQTRETTYSPHGSGDYAIYELEIDPVTKQETLKQVGSQDNYALIQSYKSEANLTNILERLTRNGESLDSVVDSGETIDYTKMPDSIVSAQKVKNSIYRKWLSFTKEQQEQWKGFDGFVNGEFNPEYVSKLKIKALEKELKKGKDDERDVKKDKASGN